MSPCVLSNVVPGCVARATPAAWTFHYPRFNGIKLWGGCWRVHIHTGLCVVIPPLPASYSGLRGKNTAASTMCSNRRIAFVWTVFLSGRFTGTASWTPSWPFSYPGHYSNRTDAIVTKSAWFLPDIQKPFPGSATINLSPSTTMWADYLTTKPGSPAQSGHGLCPIYVRYQRQYSPALAHVRLRGALPSAKATRRHIVKCHQRHQSSVSFFPVCWV